MKKGKKLFAALSLAAIMGIAAAGYSSISAQASAAAVITLPGAPKIADILSEQGGYYKVSAKSNGKTVQGYVKKEYVHTIK